MNPQEQKTRSNNVRELANATSEVIESIVAKMIKHDKEIGSHDARILEAKRVADEAKEFGLNLGRALTDVQVPDIMNAIQMARQYSDERDAVLRRPFWGRMQWLFLGQ